MLDGRGLAGKMGDIERAIRKLEAAAVSIVAEAERREVLTDDGHVGVRGWVKASLRISDGEVLQRVRSARLCADQPDVLASMRTGRLGVAQLRDLARVYANPRCRRLFGDAAPTLVDVATGHTFEVFRRVLHEWEAVADADGAHCGHDRAHTSRSARGAVVGDGYYLDAHCGNAQGDTISEVWNHFA